MTPLTTILVRGNKLSRFTFRLCDEERQALQCTREGGRARLG